MNEMNPSARLGLTVPTIPMQPPVTKGSVALARDLCAQGYEEIWLAELDGSESYALAGALSQAVPGVRLATGVVPMQTRTPMIHAMGAASLSELTSGQFVLGLGVSSENIVRGWGGQPFDRPLQRMKEHVTVLRGLLQGDRVDHKGETLSMSRFRLASAPIYPVPIYIGALNPGMLRLAGAMADGVVLNMVPESRLGQVLNEVRMGAVAAGRDPHDLEVVARLHVLVDDDLKRARDVIRKQFAPYVATQGYNRFFSWIGYEEAARGVLAGFRAKDRARVASAMTDELCDAIGIVGSLERVRARIQDYARKGVDVCVINPVTADPRVQRNSLLKLVDCLYGLHFRARGVVRSQMQA